MTSANKVCPHCDGAGYIPGTEETFTRICEICGGDGAITPEHPAAHDQPFVDQGEPGPGV